MPEPSQVAGGGQPARAAADDQHALAAANGGKLELPPLLERQVSEEPLDRVDGNRAIEARAVAVALTRVVTDPSVDRGERVVGNQCPPRTLVVAVLDLSQVALDVLPRRTGRVARREQVDVHRSIGPDRAGARVTVREVRQWRDVARRARRPGRRAPLGSLESTRWRCHRPTLRFAVRRRGSELFHSRCRGGRQTFVPSTLSAEQPGRTRRTGVRLRRRTPVQGRLIRSAWPRMTAT